MSASVEVLIVQDPSPQRSQLVRVLQRRGDIVVVGETARVEAAIEQMTSVRPDVVVIDLQLGDGSSQHAIEQIMARVPTPILVLSASIDGRQSTAAVKALVAGALDALPTQAWTDAGEDELRGSIRQLSKVQVIRHPRGGRDGTPPRSAGGERPVVALAASTGGPSALAELLSGLDGLRAPVLVVQHLHPEFTTGLLDWMSRASALPVEMAEHGSVAQAGHVYLAPGGRHLRLGFGYELILDPTPASPHRPSADQLFHSVAERAGASGVGVLLTGMGEDGARGLLDIHLRGGRTFAQNEESCAVFGMPRAAQRIGAVSGLLPLDQLAGAVRRAVSGIRT